VVGGAYAAAVSFLNQAQKKIYILNKMLPRPALEFFVERLYRKNADRIGQILTSDFEGFGSKWPIWTFV